MRTADLKETPPQIDPLFAQLFRNMLAKRARSVDGLFMPLGGSQGQRQAVSYFERDFALTSVGVGITGLCTYRITMNNKIGETLSKCHNSTSHVRFACRHLDTSPPCAARQTGP